MAPIVLLWFCMSAMLNGVSSSNADISNIISVSHGPGKRDIFAKFTGNTASESVVGTNRRDGVILRRVTDGRQLVQILGDWNHQIRDCTITNDARYIQTFNIATEERFTEHMGQRSAALPLSSPGDFSFDLRSVANFSKHLIKMLPAKFNEGQNLSDDFSYLLSLLDVNDAQSKCLLHQQNLDEQLMKPGQNQRNYEGGDRSAKTKGDLHRTRRSAFMIPGTLWCGPGNDAESYNHLGEDNSTDSCCREHDHCPHCVESWTARFGIFNYRLYAISDCECDRRFKKCLGKAGTHKSEVVGNWYFNILQLSCFELSYKPTCEKYDGWFSSKCRRFRLEPYGEVSTIGPIVIDDKSGNATTGTASVVSTDDEVNDRDSDAKAESSSASDH